MNEAVKKVCAINPEFAKQAVIDSLTADATVGPLITAIIALIKAGITNLPAILAELEAMGITIPSWVSLIITLLLALMAKE